MAVVFKLMKSVPVIDDLDLIREYFLSNHPTEVFPHLSVLQHGTDPTRIIIPVDGKKTIFHVKYRGSHEGGDREIKLVAYKASLDHSPNPRGGRPQSR